MAEGRHSGGFGSLLHLAWRFAGSLPPVGPRASSQAWAIGHLNSAERSLFLSMSAADRRHAVGVARRALQLATAGGRAGAVELPPGFVAAALLHDVGKVESRLGTFARVFATVASAGLGRDPVLARGGGRPAGRLATQKGRFASYLEHDRLGGEMLGRAGSEPLTELWARDHHLPEERWRVDRVIGHFLKEADGD